MFQIALREKLPIWTETPVTDFVVENGRVCGVIAEHEGKETRIDARDGVLINVGGLSRNTGMRNKYQPQPSSDRWTNANPGDTGEIIEAAIRLGAALDCMDEAWWIATSMGPNETWPEGAVTADGAVLPLMHHLDLSLPHSMVDQKGDRFCNEAGAYMEVGQRMYERQRTTGKAVPSWVIMDSRQRKYYLWGTAAPGQIPKQWLESGYLVRAESIAQLCGKCDIDVAALERTVARFKDFCNTGVDEDYVRGGKQFDRCHGDPRVTPNPNLGLIDKPLSMRFACTQVTLVRREVW